MNRFRLLLTKKVSPSLVLQAGLRGVDVLEKEFIKIVPVVTKEIKDVIEKLAEKEHVIIFTSKNAVAAISPGGKLTTKAWKVFCIEGATKQYVEKFITGAHIVGTAQNASELANVIVNDGKIKNAVFFCGDKKLNTLPETLRKHNIHVEEIVVYSTQPSPEKIIDDYRAVCFFSPSAVESFFSANKLSQGVVCLSVGKTTTEALKKFTSNPILTAEKPAEEVVINMAINLSNVNRY